MKKVIITSVLTQSEPFTIDDDETVTLQAKGLQGTDYAIVEIVQTTSVGRTRTACCPGEVVLPEVANAVPLRCPNGARHILTQRHPWLELTGPRGVELRVRVVANDVSVVTVEADWTKAGPTCAACACVEPWCPTYYLPAPGCQVGYGFSATDERDPEATVNYTSASGQTVFLFPTARPGATVLITDAATGGGGAVIGYAANRSNCSGA